MSIPLYILAPMVIVGIALTGLAVKLSGLSKTAKIANLDQAESLLRRDFAELSTLNEGFMTVDGFAALFPLAEGVGLVEAFGDRFVTRILAKGDVRTVTVGSEPVVDVNFGEFTHPAGRYAFETADMASKAADMLKQLQRGG